VLRGHGVKSSIPNSSARQRVKTTIGSLLRSPTVPAGLPDHMGWFMTVALRAHIARSASCHEKVAAPQAIVRHQPEAV
jgi:hypothetical protein